MSDLNGLPQDLQSLLKLLGVDTTNYTQEYEKKITTQRAMIPAEALAYHDGLQAKLKSEIVQIQVPLHVAKFMHLAFNGAASRFIGDKERANDCATSIVSHFGLIPGFTEDLHAVKNQLKDLLVPAVQAHKCPCASCISDYMLEHNIDTSGLIKDAIDMIDKGEL